MLFIKMWDSGKAVFREKSRAYIHILQKGDYKLMC